MMRAGSMISYTLRSALAAGAFALGLAFGADVLHAQGTTPPKKGTTPAKGAPAAGKAAPASKKGGAGTPAATKAAARATPAQLALGKQHYGTTCVACHQAAGEGVPGTYPPLAGSDWVTGDQSRLAHIILHGVTGEMEVAGETYSGVMPGWGPMMTDEEIAAVMTYIRASWGNKAPPVKTETVAAARKQHSNRTAPWTVAELAAQYPKATKKQ